MARPTASSSSPTAGKINPMEMAGKHKKGGKARNRRKNK
jgi:hypothetical protein